VAWALASADDDDDDDEGAEGEVGAAGVDGVCGRDLTTRLLPVLFAAVGAGGSRIQGWTGDKPSITAANHCGRPRWRTRTRVPGDMATASGSILRKLAGSARSDSPPSS